MEVEDFFFPLGSGKIENKPGLNISAFTVALKWQVRLWRAGAVFSSVIYQLCSGAVLGLPGVPLLSHVSGELDLPLSLVFYALGLRTVTHNEHGVARSVL